MRRKDCFLGAFLALLLLGVSAVFGGGQSDQAAAPVTITFWRALGGLNGEVTVELIEQFQKAYPDIRVDHSFTGDYFETQQKLMAAIAAKDPPSVSQIMDESVALFANANSLADLEPYAKGSRGSYKVDLNDFIKGFMWYSKPKDKLVALPWNKSTPLMYYNTQMLQRAGVKAPDPGYTWQEFEAAAEKLTIRKGNDVDVYGCVIPIDEWFWEALMWGNGGDFFDAGMTKSLVNQSPAVEVTQWWVDMTKKGIMKAPPGKQYNAWDNARVDFISSKTAMVFLSTGNIAGFKDTVPFGTAFMPKGKKSFATPYGGAHVAIFDAIPDREKAATWTFIAWLTDRDQTVSFAKKTGYMPIRTSAMSSTEMREFFNENPNYETAVKQLEFSRGLPIWVHMIEALDKVREAALSAVLGETTAQQAADELAATLDKMLKE